VNYLNDNSSITSQIIFGNSTFGSSYDLDVHVLAGARVEVNGNVFHDPA